MIEIDNVSKNYGQLRAVKDVSFKVNKGEIIGLLGPNAAGKTTLMRIMTGYMPATEGKVRIAGFDVYDSPMEVKRRVGYLPEHPPLYGDMSVRSFLGFTAEIKGVPARERRERVDKAIEATGLGSVHKRLIENISKGYKQRVGLAQALVHDPEVLILDEPMVGLDPKQIIEVRNLVRGLSQDHTIMLSSHILPEVSAMCDRIVILNEGSVVAMDTLEGLARKVRGGDQLKVRIAGGKPEEVLEAVKGVAGVTGAEMDETDGPGAQFRVDCKEEESVREALFRMVVDKKWTLLEVYRPELSLEEVFLKMTAGDREVAASV